METSSLKKFALQARRMLLEQVQNQLELVLQPDSRSRRDNQTAVAQLLKQIDLSSREQVIEQAAYNWFNRFCALRFMDANRYTRIGTVSPAEGFNQPEILAEAKQGHIEEGLQIDRAQVMGLLDGTLSSNDPQQEAYRLLLVATCNQYHRLMPFLFEEIADYTELLMPDDLLSDHSILTQMREVLTTEVCRDVEVIGWLYQFYISEKKDDVFAALKKGKKITPENIPAATQLFTPHWIVRYLIENSLGRLWMLNHPESKLFQNMKDRGEDCYYIEPEEPETDFLQISSPEEIKICDPACGSGHMLTYAFDLLYAIYEEQGYPATDIPRLILTHNLYGVEIDQRAGALAAFALTMKAREKYRRFFQSDKVVQPNICVLENIQIDPEDLSAYMDKVGRDLFSGGLQRVVNQWEEADNFGSLIQPMVTDVTDVMELLRERKLGEDLFLQETHLKVLKALKQADYLNPKYHVVVANPPYMGSSGFNSSLKQLSKEQFPRAKSNLFSMFIERNSELATVGGCIAMITMQAWMFLSRFTSFRGELLHQHTISSLVQLGAGAFDSIGGEVVTTAAFVLQYSNDRDSIGTFIDVTSDEGEEEKKTIFLDALATREATIYYTASVRDFDSVPDRALAYTASDRVIELFKTYEPLSDSIETREGLTTGSNDDFLRFWHEVSLRDIALGITSNDEAKKSGLKWFPYIKGGDFRKWSGNYEFVVNWQNDGEAVRNNIDKDTGRVRSHNYNGDYAFQEGFTWSSISSSNFAVRNVPSGFMFDTKGPMGFPKQLGSNQVVQAFLNSPVSNHIIKMLAPTLDFKLGHVLNLPFDSKKLFDTKSLAGACIQRVCSDWDAGEESWNFRRLEILPEEQKLFYLSQRYKLLREVGNQKVVQHASDEEAINRIVISEYGLDDEIEPSVNGENVTLKCNPTFRYGSNKSESELESLFLADTMRELISYAVGCMLGRYSLDKPGLILANQGETADDYRQQIPEPTFAPDEDNVIPLLNGDWFEDDITARFKEFLKVTLGTEHFEKNLIFLEDGLYPENQTGKKRKTVRDYFLKDFYNDHVKMYKKRPIYWLFSSPKGTFNALIYIHRYRPDSVSVVLDYLRNFQIKIGNEIERLQSVADSASAAKSDKAKALKLLTQYKKEIQELEEYERETLYPLATDRKKINLDEGVKFNYNEFGTALKKVTGLTGK